MSWLNKAKQIAVNLPGWHTNRRIVVFESDDWGSIRMSTAEARDRLKEKGHNVAENPYQLHDALETTDDVILLNDTLNAVLDKKGFPGKFTLNYCVANPDFQKIKESDFRRYHREPFNTTYERYGESEGVIEKVHKGIAQGVLDIQFHGTEHLNVNRWMKALQKKDKLTMEAFMEGIFSPAIANSTGYSMEYMDALDYDNQDEVKEQIQHLKVGLKTFKRVWKKKPVSFIAPCYRWSESIESFLAKEGIKYIQGQRLQLHPKNVPGYTGRKIYRYTGQKNKYGQIYTVRNVVFEPSLHGRQEALRMAKNQISMAFRMKVPAIVSSHRINYTSRLDKENRDKNVNALQILLNWITHDYPEVEFMSSSMLGELIKRGRS